MHIDIHVPRPWLTFGLIVSVVALAGWGGMGGLLPVGGESKGTPIAHAQQAMQREYLRQAVLERREEILRIQLQELETEAMATQDPNILREITGQRSALLQLFKERRRSEQLLLASLEQLWQSEGTDVSDAPANIAVSFQWPVLPQLGISAFFNDPSYQARFGFPHHGIDLPVEQGKPVYAAGGGIVVAAKDNGLGYSYVRIQHSSGLQTIYGHVSKIMARVGERVRAGQLIALSGGRPGADGSGAHSTGPHLHFALQYHGKLVDPLLYLVKHGREPTH